MSYLRWCCYGHRITTKGSILVKEGEPYKKGEYPRCISVYICKEHYEERENNPDAIVAKEQIALREEFYHGYMKGEERYQTKEGAKRYYPKKRTREKAPELDLEKNKERTESYAGTAENASEEGSAGDF